MTDFASLNSVNFPLCFKKTRDGKVSEVRCFYWESIFYPTPSFDVFNLMIYFENRRQSVLISPCHDSDVDDNGVVKKAHHHVIVFYTGGRGASVPYELFFNDSLNGCFYGLGPITNIRSSVRYLCHLDSFDDKKHKYSTDSILNIGGVEYKHYLEDYDLLKLTDILKYARENKFVSFRQLLDSIVDNYPNRVDIICKYSYVLKNYIES